MSCICVVFEKQIVLRTKRLMRVRNGMCLRSIFWVCRWFVHHPDKDEDEPLDWIFEEREGTDGTLVCMELSHNASHTPKEVFDQFTSEGDYGFTRTVVPVRLAQYGDEKLVSRSQAKRLLAGIDRFKNRHAGLCRGGNDRSSLCR